MLSKKIAAIIVTVAGLMGCSGDPDSSRLIQRRPLDAEIVGVWTGEWTTARNDLPKKCHLTFSQDGKFFGDVATDLRPRKELEDDKGTAAGEWEVLMVDKQWRVKLSWRNSSRVKVIVVSELMVIEENNRIGLRAIDGDPDAPSNVMYFLKK